MRVLQINAVFKNKSTGRIVEDIHCLALQRGIDSHVAFAFSPTNEKETNTYRIGNVLDRKIHAILCR